MSTTKRPGSDTSWVRRAPLAPIGFFVTWQMIVCLARSICSILQVLVRALALAAALDLVGVEVDVAPVEHRVLGGADVDERRLHARQHVLDLAEVDVAVDLRDVVGRPRHVVLDQGPALEHGDLGGLRARRGRPSGSARPDGRCAPGPARASSTSSSRSTPPVGRTASIGESLRPPPWRAACWPPWRPPPCWPPPCWPPFGRPSPPPPCGLGRRAGACAWRRPRRRRPRRAAASRRAGSGHGVADPAACGPRAPRSSGRPSGASIRGGRGRGGRRTSERRPPRRRRARPPRGGRAARGRAGRWSRALGPRRRRSGRRRAPSGRGRVRLRPPREPRRRALLGTAAGRRRRCRLRAVAGRQSGAEPSRRCGHRPGGPVGRSVIGEIPSHDARSSACGVDVAPRGPPSGRGIGSRRAPSTSVHWWVRSTRPSTQVGVEGPDQLGRSEAAGLGGQLGEEHRAAGGG